MPSVLRRVRRVGSSYTVFIPVMFSEVLDLDGLSFMYAFLDGNRVVYSEGFREGARKVKLRAQARYRDRVYYAITIPKAFAERLGIGEGDVVALELMKHGFSVSKVRTLDDEQRLV